MDTLLLEMKNDSATEQNRLEGSQKIKHRIWEDPLEEEMTTHSSILAWRISMDRGGWRARVQGVSESQTRLSN